MTAKAGPLRDRSIELGRYGRAWTPEEDAVVRDRELTVATRALRTGRTYDAIVSRYRWLVARDAAAGE